MQNYLALMPHNHVLEEEIFPILYGAILRKILRVFVIAVWYKDPNIVGIDAVKNNLFVVNIPKNIRDYSSVDLGSTSSQKGVKVANSFSITGFYRVPGTIVSGDITYGFSIVAYKSIKNQAVAGEGSYVDVSDTDLTADLR